jgi:hypothetical protein
MIKKLERDHLAADLATVGTMIQTLPEQDILGRIGFEARRDSLARSLRNLDAHPEAHAAAALVFGGEPVRGALGIRSDFAGDALSRYQDMVAKILANRERGNLGERGVVPLRKAATLHLTNIVHGSFGFLLEELSDEPQEPLFATELKSAVDETARLITSFADEDDERFATALVSTDPRVFNAVADFFKFVRSNGASFHLISGDIDKVFNTQTIEVTAQRAQLTQLSEDEQEFSGDLLGVLPEAHRFELRTSPDGDVIEGAVSPEITSHGLLDLSKRLVGRRCRARMQVRKIERQGKSPRFSYMLLSAEPDG